MLTALWADKSVSRGVLSPIAEPNKNCEDDALVNDDHVNRKNAGNAIIVQKRWVPRQDVAAVDSDESVERTGIAALLGSLKASQLRVTERYLLQRKRKKSSR